MAALGPYDFDNDCTEIIVATPVLLDWFVIDIKVLIAPDCKSIAQPQS